MLKKLKTKTINFIPYLLIILTGMNIFNKGSVVLFIFCLYCLFIVPLKEIKGNAVVFLLIAFAVFGASCCVVNKGKREALFEIIKLFNYALTYIVGQTSYRLAKDKNGFLNHLLFAIFLGLTFHVALILAYNMHLGGIEGRVAYSFWTKERIAVTLIGLLSSGIIGWSFYGLFLSKKKGYQIFSILSLGIMFYVSFATATRTPILLFVVVYIALIGIFFAYSGKKARIRVFLVLLLFLGVGLLVYFFDLFGLKTMIMNSSLFARFGKEGLETSRGSLTLQFIEHMPEYLWGGGNITKIIEHETHNVWLQAYDLYGALAALCLAVATVYILYDFVRLIFRKDKKKGLDYAIMGLMLSILIQCALEPIVTGFPIIFWFFLLISGVLRERLKERGMHEIIADKRSRR